MPSSTFSKHKLLQTSSKDHPPSFHQDTFPVGHTSEKDLLKPVRDIRYLDSPIDDESTLDAATGESGYESSSKNFENVLTHSQGENVNLNTPAKTNFTDASDNLVSVSSDAVLSYEVPATDLNDSRGENSSVKQSTDIVIDVPSPSNSDLNSSVLLPVSKTVQPGYATENSVELNTHIYIDYINQINLTDSILSTSIFPSTNSDENVTNSLPSTDSEKKLNSGAVAGIVIAVLISVTLLSSKCIYLSFK